MQARTGHHDTDAIASAAYRRRLRRAGELLLAGLTLLVLSGLFSPLIAYALILGACVLIGHGGNRVIRALLDEGLRLRSRGR